MKLIKEQVKENNKLIAQQVMKESEQLGIEAFKEVIIIFHISKKAF